MAVPREEHDKAIIHFRAIAGERQKVIEDSRSRGITIEKQMYVFARKQKPICECLSNGGGVAYRIAQWWSCFIAVYPDNEGVAIGIC